MAKKKTNEEPIDIEIIPISRKIGKKEALIAIKSTQKEENFWGGGASGYVYVYKEKYVIKKCYNNFYSEISSLKDFEGAIADGLDVGDSQRGICAFRIKTGKIDAKKNDTQLCNKSIGNTRLNVQSIESFPDINQKLWDNEKKWRLEKEKNETRPLEGYIISTKVPGVNILKRNDLALKRNEIQLLLKVLINLDKGIVQKSELNLRYIYLHYDISMRNFILSENTAGLIDYEFFRKEDLEWYLGKRDVTLFYNILDDSGSLPSNLRLFEIDFLWTHFHVLYFSKKKANCYNKEFFINLFDMYLSEKSKYIKELSSYHTKIAPNSGAREKLNLISEKEKTISKLLEPINNSIREDIRLAEIYMIQLANFYFQSQIRVIAGGITPQRVIDYKNEATEYFNTQLELAKNNNDNDRIMYYNCCILFVNRFRKIEETKLEQNNDNNVEIKLAPVFNDFFFENVSKNS